MEQELIKLLKEKIELQAEIIKLYERLVAELDSKAKKAN